MVNKYNVNISEDTACHISNKNILNKGHISYVDAAMIPEYMWRWEQIWPLHGWRNRLLLLYIRSHYEEKACPVPCIHWCRALISLGGIFWNLKDCVDEEVVLQPRDSREPDRHCWVCGCHWPVFVLLCSYIPFGIWKGCIFFFYIVKFMWDRKNLLCQFSETQNNSFSSLGTFSSKLEFKSFPNWSVL